MVFNAASTSSVATRKHSVQPRPSGRIHLLSSPSENAFKNFFLSSLSAPVSHFLGVSRTMTRNSAPVACNVRMRRMPPVLPTFKIWSAGQ